MAGLTFFSSFRVFENHVLDNYLYSASHLVIYGRENNPSGRENNLNGKENDPNGKENNPNGRENNPMMTLQTGHDSM